MRARSGNPWVGKTGRAIREAAAIRNWRCPDCGHAEAHRELQPTYELGRDADDQITIIETPHPDYKPGEFHCSKEGCDCVTHGEVR